MSTTEGLPIDMIGPDTSQDLAQLPPATRAVLALKSSATEYELRSLATKHAGITVIKCNTCRRRCGAAKGKPQRERYATTGSWREGSPQEQQAQRGGCRAV